MCVSHRRWVPWRWRRVRVTGRAVSTRAPLAVTWTRRPARAPKSPAALLLNPCYSTPSTLLRASYGTNSDLLFGIRSRAAYNGRIQRPLGAVHVIFKHEDYGTAPKFALRLMQVMGAQPAPA